MYSPGCCSGVVDDEFRHEYPEEDVRLEYKIASEIEETEADFIIRRIQTWAGCTSELSETVISKQIIIRAITCFKEEHAEEFKSLYEESLKRTLGKRGK